MKKKIIIANWKLNGNRKFIKKYIKKIKNIKNNSHIEISISPPIPYLWFTYLLIKNTKISITSQNIDINISGPFTGDISGKNLKDINVKYVIIGHSERKKYHFENKIIILKKIITSKKSNIIPIICIGENIKEYIQKKSIKICKKQIKYIIKNTNINIFNKTIIAYEPIWAIGTGKNANIKHINKIHNFIKKYIKKKTKKKIKNMKIIYGGSVNNKNSHKIISQKNVDGLLIGKSSLNIKEFKKILNTI